MLNVSPQLLRLIPTKQKLLVFFNLLNVTKPKVAEFVYLNQMQDNLVKHINTTARSKSRGEDIQYNLLTDPIINTLKVNIPYSYLFTIFEEQIDNAIKFSCPKSAIIVNFKLEKEDLFIEIINEGQLKIKFNPNEMFMEVNNSLNGSQGFGLGIFIIKKLCSLFDCMFTLTEDKSFVIAKTKMKCTY
ncbi:sensory histidine kinase CreC [Pedobacter glucosidilyticus]|nr:sensory histidine kinase CreC [Pedobacter glucosidilyticus]